MLTWKAYLTDLYISYPFFPLSAKQTNTISTLFSPLDFLPDYLWAETKEIKHPCSVSGLIPRTLEVIASDNAYFSISIPFPFETTLVTSLKGKPEIKAFMLIGEKVKHYRLRRGVEDG
ncbi:MAG: hypothetical protein AB4368_22110 [Xenococcaceae cyanobacterium]